MSDVTEKTLDQKFVDHEDLITVELIENELEMVTGAWFDGFFPAAFNNSQSLALTSLATSNNSSGVW